MKQAREDQETTAQAPCRSAVTRFLDCKSIISLFSLKSSASVFLNKEVQGLEGKLTKMRQLPYFPFLPVQSLSFLIPWQRVEFS